MAIILLLSGPNLNLLGEREPQIYGSASLADCVSDASVAAEARGHLLEHLQSNHEGDLVDAIHRSRGRCAAIIVNPGAFSHYSYAIADALATFDGTKVELHLSNPSAREEWRRHSVTAAYVTGVVAGFGRAGYGLAVEAVCASLDTA